MTAHRREGDSGVLSISLALVFPVVLFLVLLVVQVALLWFTKSVALTAAREGADAGRFYNTGTEKVAQTTTEDFLAPASGVVGKATVATKVVTDSKTNVSTITVTVTVQPLFLPPGLDLQITQSASAPLERPIAP